MRNLGSLKYSRSSARMDRIQMQRFVPEVVYDAAQTLPDEAFDQVIRQGVDFANLFGRMFDAGQWMRHSCCGRPWHTMYR